MSSIIGIIALDQDKLCQRWCPEIDTCMLYFILANLVPEVGNLIRDV